jgi:hypothetical protein
MYLNNRFTMEDLDPTSLLEPTQFIILPVINEASLLEFKYEDSLLPVKPGVYRTGDIYPLGEKKIDDLLSVGFENRIFSYADNTLANLESKTNNSKRLYSQPTLPSRGLQLIELCINQEICKINPFARNSHTEAAINRLITNTAEITSDDIANDCSCILKHVIDFIGNDVWHIYFVRLKGSDITIVKTIDYRIYDWHCSQYKKLEELAENKY